MDWRGGTLNNSTYLANVTVDGSAGPAGATIDPFGIYGTGTVTTGSNLNFVNGATGTFNPGTVTFNNNAGMTANAATVNVAADQNVGVNWVKGNGSTLPQFTLAANSSYQVYRLDTNQIGVHNTELAILNQGGTVQIADNIHMVVSGRVGADGPSYSQTSGLTELYSAGNLVVDFGMKLTGGTLSINPIIANPVATINGDVTDDGATIDFVTADVGTIYATLKINGNFNWSSGTYKPAVDASGTSSQASYIWATKVATIGQNAQVAPVFNGDGAVSGISWVILQADMGINGNLPPVPQGYTSFRSVNGDQWLLRKN